MQGIGLDSYRREMEIKNFQLFFNNLVEYNKKDAIILLNEDGLSFTSLFVLIPQISQQGLLNDLNLRNRTAIEISNMILWENSFEMEQKLASQNNFYSTLVWIAQTTIEDDGLNDSFDNIIDFSIILLITIYRHFDILPGAVDLIFKRHRRNSHLYDLVWALGLCDEINFLNHVLKYLNSPEPMDVKLAKKLLAFVPPEYIREEENDSHVLYLRCTHWIKENYYFLYCTGETFQQTRRPLLYKLSLTAKYLCRKVSVKTGELLDELTDREKELLSEFSTLDINTKVLLANCSYILYRQNQFWWNVWINNPIAVQVDIARTRIGGLQ